MGKLAEGAGFGGGTLNVNELEDGKSGALLPELEYEALAEIPG